MADNASITILRNTQANINAEPIKDGNILFTTDQDINVIYTDVGTKRIKIGGTVPIDSTITANSVNPVTSKAIYNEFDDVQRQICTNFLNPTAPTQTINGVTFTNNEDGTYTVNGTASSTAYYPLADAFTDLNLSSKYKIVGCPRGGSENTYTLYDGQNLTNKDFGNGFVYTPTKQPKLYIRINNGTTCNNLIFKPMITTDLSATYDDFVPYTGDSGRLNEDISDVNRRLTQVQGDSGRLNEDISDVNRRLTQVQNQIVPIASIEIGETASKAYNVGDFLVKDGILYKVTDAIVKGDALTVGTNIVLDTVGGEIKALNERLTQKPYIVVDVKPVHAGKHELITSYVIPEDGVYDIISYMDVSVTDSGTYNNSILINPGNTVTTYNKGSTVTRHSMLNGGGNIAYMIMSLEKGDSVKVFAYTAVACDVTARLTVARRF